MKPIKPLTIRIVIYSLGLVILTALIYLFVNKESNTAYQQALKNPIKTQLCGIYQGKVFENYYVGTRKKQHTFLQFVDQNRKTIKFRYIAPIYKNIESFKTLKQYAPTCITYADGIIVEFK